jgi:hypothetical protein
MTILRWKEDTSPAHGIICSRNDTGRLSHHPLRMQILITCYTFQHLLPMAPYLNLLPGFYSLRPYLTQSTWSSLNRRKWSDLRY